MSDNRQAAAVPVAIGMVRFEDSIDDSLIDGSTLFASMLRSRKDANLAAEVGHPDIEEAYGVLGVMIAARTRLIALHRSLDKLRRRLGVPEMGDGDKLPGDLDPGGIRRDQNHPMMAGPFT